ncbi:10948_t:CDS:2, partial [Dentiscutata heterogama]
LSNPITNRNDVNIRRLNIFLTVVIPILSITSSLIMLYLHHNPLFEVIDTGGICSISRHGDYRLLLFIIRTVPEFVPIYPACILSVITVIPVVGRVFSTYRSRESFALPWQSKISPKPGPLRSTRAGPPPETASISTRPTIPPNVLLRMGSWCCLLIISGIPDATIKFIENIHYVIYNNDIKIIDNPFWNRNGTTLHMCLSMILFLLCFGTGEFATKQYGILWTKIIGFICCSPSRIKTRQIDTVGSRSHDTIDSRDSDIDTSAIPTSFIASPPMTYPRIDKKYLTGARAGWVTCKSNISQTDSGDKSIDISSPPIVYSNSAPQIDKKYLTGARAGWVTKSTLYQNSKAPIKSDSGNKTTDKKGSSTQYQPEIISQNVSLSENSSNSSLCIKQDDKVSHTGSTTDQIFAYNLEEIIP